MPKRRTREIFSRRVRTIRNNYGWTQSELSKRAGISTRYIQKIEGHCPPGVTLDVIDKIARALKVACSDLVRNL